MTHDLNGPDCYQYELEYADGTKLLRSDNAPGANWTDPNDPTNVVVFVRLLPLYDDLPVIESSVPVGTLPVFATGIIKGNAGMGPITSKVYKIGWNYKGARNMIGYDVANHKVVQIVDDGGGKKGHTVTW
jgi:hypothetical protein